MSSKQIKLAELNSRMSHCSVCVLRIGCKQVVPGEGSAEAEIMFIGEAPGKKEDELGRPFVGAAGKFLDEMLGIINLKREQVYPHTKNTIQKNNDKKYTPENKGGHFGVGVYIANVVKCRPPENRDPLPEEFETCRPWLLKQIKIIDPKLIVTLGRHSMERFLPNQKISQVHGTLIIKTVEEIGKRNFYTLYHPAAALYNGSLRKVLIKDFKRIPRILEKIKGED